VKPWKIQKFFGDVVYDLRQRNLLLVAIMLAVAVVAVPLLISMSGSGSSVPAGPAAQASAGIDPEAQNAVVAYHPGVRNFKQRLRDLSAKDPFKQQYTSAAAAGNTLDQVTSTSSTSSGESTSVSGGTGSGNGGGGGNGGAGSKKTNNQTLYTYYVTDVSVGESGGTLAPVDNVSQFQFLPSADKPVLVYLGTSSGGSQALFLVSNDVASVGGNGTCFPTADACQLLGLNPGAGADLIYGPDGKTYHLDVTKIKRVTSSKPPA
jgi:hypothetical protein